MNVKTIAMSMTILVVAFVSAWTANRLKGSTASQAMEDVPLPVASLPQVHDNRDDMAPLEPERTLLEWDSYVGAPHPALIDDDLYLVSSATSSIGELYRFDRGGALVDLYHQRGHGPGELAEPAWIQALDDEVFVSERNKAMVHVLDRDLNYREKLSFTATGKIVAAADQWIARWLYHRFEQHAEAGIMLTIHDRQSGRPLHQLVPVEKMLHAVTLDGGAVLHREILYAVSANTGCLDIIDTRTWSSRRYRLRPDLAPYQLERWQDWSRRKAIGRSQVGDIEQWLETFRRPTGISVVADHLVVLYAGGQTSFFDIHRLDGQPLFSNQRVAMRRPFLNGSHLVAIADIGDRQELVYVDLEPVVRRLTRRITETN